MSTSSTLKVAALLVTALCFGSVPALAQTGTVEGRVVEESAEAPLPGANVYIAETDLGTAARADGSFTIENVPVGQHTVVASVLGFAEARQEITVEADETTSVVLRLTERPIEIAELVVERMSLTGGGQDLDAIPGSAHYIGPRELERFSYSDVHRVLREVPGVYLQEEDGYGLRPNIGLRGTGVERSSKITVMEDGVLAAPAPYAAPSAYYFPTTGRMQGVEVRKGSSQIKYGPYTTGGALNLVSTPIPSELTGRFDVMAGQEEERLIHAYAGDSYENFGFLAETYQMRSNGFKNLSTGGDTGFDKKDYLAKFRLNTDPDAAVYQALTFKIGQTNETSNETYLGLTEADFAESPYLRYAGSQEDVMNTEHGQYQLRHVTRPAAFMDVTTTLYRNTFKRNWYKLDQVRASADREAVKIGALLEDPDEYADELAIVTGATSPNDNALDVKNNNREYYSQGVQSVAGFKFETPGLEHELEIGARLHEDQIDRFQWVDTYRMAEGAMQLTEEGTPGTESNRVTTARAFAAFAQHRLRYGALSVVPGLRYETITIERETYDTDTPEGRSRAADPLEVQKNQVDVLMPGLGVSYEWTEALSTFLGVHKGFAPPGPQEETRPEESINYEAGARYSQTGLRAEGVVFFNDYSNLLGRDLAAIGGDPSGNQYNGGGIRVSGLELSAGYDLGLLTAGAVASIPFDLSYTYTRSSFENSFESDFGPWGTVEEGDELPYLPRHQLAATLGLEAERFGVALSGRYVSRMRTVAGQGDISASERIDGHVVLDASANYRITPQARLFASVRNVTDEVYVAARRPAGLRPGLPRTFLIGIKTGF